MGEHAYYKYNGNLIVTVSQIRYNFQLLMERNTIILLSSYRQRLYCKSSLIQSSIKRKTLNVKIYFDTLCVQICCTKFLCRKMYVNKKPNQSVMYSVFQIIELNIGGICPLIFIYSETCSWLMKFANHFFFAFFIVKPHF